jgi:hypothetical protein
LERKSPASIHLRCIGESTHAALVAHPSHVRVDDHVDRHIADLFGSRPTTLLPTAIEHARGVDNNDATGPTNNAQALLRKNFKSVLGIEVRSTHQRNIGRIVDLLVDPDGSVKAAIVEFGGFLGIGTRKIAIAWPDLRFDTEGKQLTAILDIPRDHLRVAPDYKPDAPAIVTKVIEPLMPSTEEPPNKVTDPPKELKPTSKRKHRLY